MTLEEAIKHCEEVEESCERGNPKKRSKSKCASEHRQLAVWLRELKAYKEQGPCDDAISRETALMCMTGVNLLSKKPEELISLFDKRIKALPSVTPTRKKGTPNRWIPVSERLPEEGEEVLVSGYDTYHKKVVVAKYQGEKYGFTCGLVSAWMPLPKPYKAESEVEE